LSLVLRSTSDEVVREMSDGCRLPHAGIEY
jgi:hypothetical protein